MIFYHSIKPGSLLNLISIKIITAFLFLLQNNFAQDKTLILNDKDYLEKTGLNVFVFSNQYNGFFYDEKTAGIELIHHGVRTSTGGAVRLKSTPEQWDLIPVVTDRKVNKQDNSIEVVLRHEDYNFDARVVVKPKDEGFSVSVYLDKPVPQKLTGNAGFNMEFLPSAYFEKTFLMDNSAGVFPLYPAGPVEAKPLSERIPQFAGHTTFDFHGKEEYVEPLPLAKGKTLIMAPEDPERMIKIESSDDNQLMLFDGRNLAQNGWYVVRSLLPAGKTGKVLEWFINPNTIAGWKHIPVISHSQVGYHPGQQKTAVIELDKNDTPLKSASLFRVNKDGSTSEVINSPVNNWGMYLRYNYLTFDFTAVKDPGLYFIVYGDQKTKPFRIDKDVYQGVWHQTLGIYLPVQMDHMFVNEAYRVWHGLSNMDDAIQAPLNHQHFDGYSMGSETDTKYKPGDRIPGLNVGGWYDAGDFDIQTGSHNAVLSSLVDSWETFSLQFDETRIDQSLRYVDMHHPDGKPDVLQQIEHGALNVVAQLKNIGHAVRGIVVPNLHQYHHLGDGSTMTDNLPYNPKLKPYESDGLSSGTPDDRWVFSTHSSWLNYGSIAALSASSRALQNYNKNFADECIAAAEKAWAEEIKLTETTEKSLEEQWFGNSTKIVAALQLYRTTKDKQYADQFLNMIWGELDKSILFNISTAAHAVPYLNNQYKEKLKPYVEKYKLQIDSLSMQNPYGVPIESRGWGSNTIIINWAITNYFLNKAYPDLIGPEYTFKALNYIFGCHPASDISFVSGVGTSSKRVAYGNNRADFAFIPGGVVPGLLFLRPDYLENKEDWPFFWGENEYVIDIGASFIFLSNAVNSMLNGK